MHTRWLKLNLVLVLCDIKRLVHKTQTLRFHIITRLTLYIQFLLLLRLRNFFFFTGSQERDVFQDLNDAASLQCVGVTTGLSLNLAKKRLLMVRTS